MITIRIHATCSTKDHVGGWSSYINGKEISGGAKNTTAPRMELTALIEGIKQIKPSSTKQFVQLIARSDYIPHGMKSFKEYQHRNFYTKGGKQVANLDLWDLLIREAVSRNIIIQSVK